MITIHRTVTQTTIEVQVKSNNGEVASATLVGLTQDGFRASMIFEDGFFIVSAVDKFIEIEEIFVVSLDNCPCGC